MKVVVRPAVFLVALSLASHAGAEPFSKRVPAVYPLAALREGREGTVGVTVEVTEQGRADKCLVTQSSGSQDLDEAACAQMISSARFAPAKDNNGNPVRGSFSTKVIWKIGRTTP